MAWSTLTTDEVLEELLPAEATMMKAAAGDRAASFVTRATAECRGAIQAGGYPLGDEGTIPDGLKSDVIALARWRWLIAFPQLAKLQTREREQAYKDAREKLKSITQQDFSVEPVTAAVTGKSGTWNSENKIVGRTHPVPRPGSQYQTQTGAYANPEGPEDQT